MNNPYYQVREFHDAFNHKQNDRPTVMEEETALNRSIWTGEELVEFLYATVNSDKDKFEKIFNSFIAGLIEAKEKILDNNEKIDNKLVAQADALTDTLYFIYGSFAVMGIEPQPLFNIVQEANMGKLWDDGKPRYREKDGKIIKPPHWEKEFAPEPRLKKEIERQLNS